MATDEEIKYATAKDSFFDSDGTGFLLGNVVSCILAILFASRRIEAEFSSWCSHPIDALADDAVAAFTSSAIAGGESSPMDL
jgi:hypothetical protein